MGCSAAHLVSTIGGERETSAAAAVALQTNRSGRDVLETGLARCGSLGTLTSLGEAKQTLRICEVRLRPVAAAPACEASCKTSITRQTLPLRNTDVCATPLCNDVESNIARLLACERLLWLISLPRSLCVSGRRGPLLPCRESLAQGSARRRRRTTIVTIIMIYRDCDSGERHATRRAAASNNLHPPDTTNSSSGSTKQY